MFEPVGPGITPGSGPGHLGLFGYDPEQFELGRGALSAAGLDFELRAGDVAARGNLATLGADGTLTDRRAGSHPRPRGARRRREAAGRRVGARHRGVLPARARAPGAGGAARSRPRPAPLRHRPAADRASPRSRPRPLDPEAKRTADLIAEVDAQVRRVLADEPKANVVLFRGFDTHRELPGFAERFGLARGGRRHLPDVPRHRPPARHGRARPSRRPHRAARHPARVVGRLRLLLPAPQVHRLGGRRRRPRAQDRGHRAARRGGARTARAVTRRDRGERRPLHAVADGRALVASRAHAAVERALRSRRRRAVRRAAGAVRARSACAPPRTSWRSCSPTPAAWPSTAPDHTFWRRSAP